MPLKLTESALKINTAPIKNKGAATITVRQPAGKSLLTFCMIDGKPFANSEPTPSAIRGRKGIMLNCYSATERQQRHKFKFMRSIFNQVE
jgi:hypothetical protein